jgi:hypothetical protein
MFDEAAAARSDDRIGIITFEIDDQTAEDLAVGMDALRTSEGVLDVLQIPAVGKKGRMVCQVQVLCRPDVLDDVIDGCFTQTTTIGLRWNMTARAKLARKMATVEDGQRPVSVKLADRPDGRSSAKADVESLRACSGEPARRQRRKKAEQKAIADAASAESCRNK